MEFKPKEQIMEKGYRVTFECYDKQNPTAILSKVTVLEGGMGAALKEC